MLFTEIPDLNEFFYGEEEPIVVAPNKKRKSLGKKYASKSKPKEKEPPRKRTKVVKSVGEASCSSPRQTENHVATSVHHEQTERGGKKKEKAMKLIPRLDRPHNGFSSKATTKVWSKFQIRVGLSDKAFDNQRALGSFILLSQWLIHRGLKNCEIHSSYNLTLLRELYVEISVTITPKLKVRGTSFKFTAKKINKFLDLAPPKRTEYYHPLHNATHNDLVEIVVVLGKRRTDWETHTNFMLKTFKAIHLTVDSNVWTNFVRHSISPTTHDSSNSVDRMFLLFCLIIGRSINLGSIILNSIRECASRTRGKLYFLGLITKMLIKNGVPRHTDDMMVKEKREKWQIDMKAVARLKHRKEKGVGASDILSLM